MQSLLSTARKTLRVVLYLRVSTEEQARHGMSLLDQRREGESKAKQLAAEAGAELQLFTFEDHHGGDILDRPVLEEMREFIRQTKPEFFVCLDPNRFSRSLKLQLIVADEIEDAGTRLVFVMQEYDPDDMMSRAFFQFRGLMAELEKAKILDQTLRGKRQKLRTGKLANGIRIYGYDFDTNADGLAINEAEAKWVRLIFQWAREGLGPELIARRLNESGVPSKLDAQWRRCVVAGILKNTTYIGLLVANKRDSRGLDAQRRLPPERRKVKINAKIRSEGDWIRVPVPAIISEQEFAEVQAIRAGFKRTAQVGVGLLSGLATCGLCGAPMGYQPAKGGHYLRCANRYPKERGTRAPAQPCRMPHIRAEGVERAVWAELERWLTEPGHVEAYLQQRGQGQSNSEPLEQVRLELEAVRGLIGEKKAEQARILHVVAKGLVHVEVSEPQLVALAADLAGLTRREGALSARLGALEGAGSSDLRAFQGQLEEIKSALARTDEEIRARLAELEPDRRRELVRRLVARLGVEAQGEYIIYPRAV